MNKRGMSTIIVTIIMITLVLAAVGVVWVIVQNILEEGADDISLGALKINLDIEKVKITDIGVEVKVKRNAGKADLIGINFIISDGVDTQVFEETTTMSELATKTFTLSYTGFVKSVEIAPVLKSESGKEKIVNVVEKEEFNPKSCLELLKKGYNTNGVYWIAPTEGEAPVQVYCDMTNGGGGWTLIKRWGNTGRNSQASGNRFGTLISNSQIGSLEDIRPDSDKISKFSDEVINSIDFTEVWLQGGENIIVKISVIDSDLTVGVGSTFIYKEGFSGTYKESNPLLRSCNDGCTKKGIFIARTQNVCFNTCSTGTSCINCVLAFDGGYIHTSELNGFKSSATGPYQTEVGSEWVR